MKTKAILLTLLIFLLTGCKFNNRSVVDFTSGQTYDSTMFYVVSQRNTDLSAKIPDDCYLPDGTPLNQYDEKAEAPSSGDVSPQTTSTSMTTVMQSLFGYGGNTDLVELSGIYRSFENIDALSLKPVMLSGKVIMPANGKFKRYILVSHYTIGSNAEAPSNCFSLEGVLAQLGYCLIIPDYLGYGVTADRIHPYLMMDATAYHVISMFDAVRKYMSARGIKPEYDDIYLLGYSQGGATTMAVQYFIEKFGSELVGDLGFEKIKIRRSFAGGGPYDVKATYDRFVQENDASYPVAVPLVIQGMIAGDPDMPVVIDSLLQPRIAEHIDEWINSKNYSTSLINNMIGTRKTDEILSPLGLNRSSDEVSELYKALSNNSIVNYNWTPQAPVYMFHSIEDETVPFEANAVRARTRWYSNNIQYNFGYYGSHVNAFLRFLSTVFAILRDED